MQVEISYNPYKMKTSMMIDGIDVLDEKKGDDYKKFRQMIERNTPLQTWIEPIAYLDWKGIVNELIPEEQNEDVKIIFSGRDIDYRDLQRAVKVQNEAREVDPPAQFTFEQKTILDDKVLAQNIDHIVKELRSPRFSALVQERNSEALKKKYSALNDNYSKAKDTEFDIVFTGLYSSGKSTILNVLMRHTVLPTSGETTTTKNCRICHNATIGNKIALTAYDKDGKIAVERREFENDADCAELFLKISPMPKDENDNKANADSQYAAVKEIRLEANLSHLYPESVSADKFKIVLIDTPGMNSAQSSKNGENLHEKIALEAVGMDTKPMVILCVEAKQNESKDIGEFMQVIARQSKQDKGGFNDRFLFLMNKSDEPIYNNDESLDGLIKKFADYLTDSAKWGKKETDGLEKVADFVPRIFPVSALMEWAVHDGAGKYSKEILKNDKWRRSIESLFVTYQKNVTSYNEEDYYLTRHCYGIPAYRRAEVEAKFQQALADGNDDRAVQLQSGMCCVEMAIQDYIARYAYPIKVRALLETFEDILIDVESVNQQYLEKMQEALRQAGEKSTKRKGVQEQKDELERKRAIVEKAERDVEENKNKLAQIRFDSSSLNNAVDRFKMEVNKNEIVSKFMASARNDYKISTGQRSSDEVHREVQEEMNMIDGVFSRALSNTNVVLRKLQGEYKAQLDQIFDFLTTTISDLKASDAFEASGYDFTKTVEWRTNFEYLDIDQFTTQVQKTIQDRTTTTKYVGNAQKVDWAMSWNPFKKLGSLFLPSTVAVPEPVNGYYKTEAIVKALNAYQTDLSVQTSEMTDAAQTFLIESKINVNTLTRRLINALNNFIFEINAREKQIEMLSRDLEGLNKKIMAHRETCEWLNALKDSLQGV